MAEKRKTRRRKDDEAQEQPTKEEYAVAKYVRFNCPIKKTTMYGNKVDFFVASKAIDCLLDSKWATGKGKTDVLFTTRDSVVQYFSKLLRRQVFFHRALKIIKKVPEKKKKKTDEEETPDIDGDKKEEKKEDDETEAQVEESKEEKKKKKKKKGKGEGDKEEKEKAEEESKKKKEKRKVKLEMHEDQRFFDGNEVYVWIYDPVSPKTFITGLLLVFGTLACACFPVWPGRLQEVIVSLMHYMMWLTGAMFIMVVLRGIVFGIVWGLTFGRHHLWLLPNLTEDVGFFDSFKPLYQYEYKGPTKDKTGEGTEAVKADDDTLVKNEEEEEDEQGQLDEMSPRTEEANEDSADDNTGSATESEQDTDNCVEKNGDSNGFELIETEECKEEDRDCEPREEKSNVTNERRD